MMMMMMMREDEDGDDHDIDDGNALMVEVCVQGLQEDLLSLDAGGACGANGGGAIALEAREGNGISPRRFAMSK